jgi:hypothetical protein
VITYEEALEGSELTCRRSSDGPGPGTGCQEHPDGPDTGIMITFREKRNAEDAKILIALKVS